MGTAFQVTKFVCLVFSIFLNIYFFGTTFSEAMLALFFRRAISEGKVAKVYWWIFVCFIVAHLTAVAAVFHPTFAFASAGSMGLGLGLAGENWEPRRVFMWRSTAIVLPMLLFILK